MYIYREFLEHIIQFADPRLIQFSITILTKRMMQRTLISNTQFYEKPNKSFSNRSNQAGRFNQSNHRICIDQTLGRSRTSSTIPARVITVNIRTTQEERRREGRLQKRMGYSPSLPKRLHSLANSNPMSVLLSDPKYLLSSSKEPASRSRLGEDLDDRAVHCLGVMFDLGDDEDTDEGTAS